MDGKILFYNETNGEGLILSSDKKKYKLKAENWEDFENMPKSGLKVEFYPNNEDALNVVIFGGSKGIVLDDEDNTTAIHQQDNKTQSKKAKQKKQLHTETTEDTKQNDDAITYKEKLQKIEKINEITEITNVNKANFVYENRVLDKQIVEEDFTKLEGIKYIPITKSYKDAFYSFFRDAIRIAQSNKVSKLNETLSYPVMRRFLITAFEHLLDKDPTFIDKDLIALRRNLEDTYFIYKDIKDKLELPNVKFETVFLAQQDVYNLVIKKVQSNAKRINLLNALIEDLENSLKTQEEELKNIQKSSHDYMLKEISVKKVRTRYVNGIDEMSILKNENTFLENISKDFINKHKIDFIDYFTKNADQLLLQITNIMNKNAFKFDTYMWTLAKKSKGIKTFFIEAQIEGGFSSKTFLKYFLKNLDTTKMNKEYKDMHKMMEYLDELDKKKIVVIDDQSYIMPQLKYFINHIDKFYNILSLSPTEAIYKMSDYHIDFLVVNVHIKKMKLLDFIDRVKNFYPNTEIILISDCFTKEVLLSAKKKGVKHFVAINVSDAKLAKTLETITSGKRG